MIIIIIIIYSINFMLPYNCAAKTFNFMYGSKTSSLFPKFKELVLSSRNHIHFSNMTYGGVEEGLHTLLNLTVDGGELSGLQIRGYTQKFPN
jgi:hypothetical protein